LSVEDTTPKPKKRRNVTLARIKKRVKASVKARLKAEAEFWKSKIGIEWSQSKSFKQALGMLLEKIDPIDTIVFIGTTILCYKTLEKAEEVVQKVTTVGMHAFMEWTWIGQALFPKYKPEMVEELEEKAKVIGVNNFHLLLLSMLIAYMIMRHGAEILKVFSGGIVGIGKMMLGIGAPI